MRLRYNLLQTTLAAGIDDNDVTVTLDAVLQEGGVDIPTIAAPDYLPITLSGTEIVWVTDYTTGATTATIERGMEDTVAVAHTTGASVQNNPTKLDYEPSTLLHQWTRDNVAASLTDQPLVLNAGVRTEVTMPRPGHIVGVSLRSNAARTAGYMIVTPTIDGALGSVPAVLDATDTQTDVATEEIGIDSFDAGQRIGAKITTDPAWAPTTADIDVAVEVVFDD